MYDESESQGIPAAASFTDGSVALLASGHGCGGIVQIQSHVGHLSINLFRGFGVMTSYLP